MQISHRIAALILFIYVLLASVASLADSEFTFAVFGDNGPIRPGVAQTEVFKRILKEIDALNPAFVVSNGDSVYGSSDNARLKTQYEEYADTIKSLLKAKVYLTLGNHDILGSKANQDFFEKGLGGLYRSFDRGNSHFIILDTEVVGEENRIAGKQLEWLKQDLDKSRRAKHKFVFMHRPMYPVDGHTGQCLDAHPKERDELHAMFVRNHVTAVFAGHEHLFDQMTKDGVRYVITGGASTLLFPSFLGTGDYNHFVLVSVKGDKVEMKAVPWREI